MTCRLMVLNDSPARQPPFHSVCTASFHGSTGCSGVFCKAATDQQDTLGTSKSAFLVSTPLCLCSQMFIKESELQLSMKYKVTASVPRDVRSASGLQVFTIPCVKARAIVLVRPTFCKKAYSKDAWMQGGSVRTWTLPKLRSKTSWHSMQSVPGKMVGASLGMGVTRMWFGLHRSW